MMVDVLVCWGWYNSSQPSQPASKYYVKKTNMSESGLSPDQFHCPFNR